MPRTYHTGADGGVQPLVARQPEPAVFGEALALAERVKTHASISHRGAPRGDLASQLSSAELSLLALLCPAQDFTLPLKMDWSALTNLAARLGCLPRLASLHLASFEGDAPEEVALLWCESRHHTAARNLLLAHEEAVLLAEFAAAGIIAVPLKGVSLARILRDDPAARSVIDIDLAVRPADAARAAALLAARGYRVSLPTELLQRAGFLRSVCEKNAEVTAVRQQAGMELLVELHWKTIALPEAGVWAALHDYEPAGVRTLEPELYFLFLCEHLAGHGWAGVRWLCDIADFLLRFADEMDAEKILRLARAAGLRRRVGITLELLDAYFGVSWSAPDASVDSLRDSRARRQAAHFLLRPLNGQAPHSPAGHHREQLAVQDSAARRLSYLWRLAQPTHVEWLRRSGDGHAQVRNAAAAWAHRAARLVGLAAASPEKR